MNKISLCFVLFNAAVFGWSSATEFSCTPNENYKQDCNTCVCSSDGKAAACTQLACLPEATESSSTESATTEGILEHVESNNHVCTPNDVKIEGCKRCRCAANGIGWFCTDIACPPKSVQKRAVHPARADCNPGDTWNDGCNNCFCTGNGLPACTLRHCDGGHLNNSRHKRSEKMEKKCIPGSTFKISCNTCFCGETGNALCTLKGCLDDDSLYRHVLNRQNLRKVSQEEYNNSNFTCEPNESFKLDCNTCKCNAVGKGYQWCTRKLCVYEEQLSTTSEIPKLL